MKRIDSSLMLFVLKSGITLHGQPAFTVEGAVSIPDGNDATALEVARQIRASSSRPGKLRLLRVSGSIFEVVESPMDRVRNLVERVDSLLQKPSVGTTAEHQWVIPQPKDKHS